MNLLIDTPLRKDDIVVETFPVGPFACNCSLIYSTTSNSAILIDPGNDFNLVYSYIENKKLKIEYQNKLIFLT